MGIKLTTHVLDTAQGRPAAAMRIDLLRVSKGGDTALGTHTTNSDGRIDGPLLADATAGTYLIVFHVGAYYAAQGHPDARRFLDEVPVAFKIESSASHYHVPLLVSPWAYSTYRGS